MTAQLFQNCVGFPVTSCFLTSSGVVWQNTLLFLCHIAFRTHLYSRVSRDSTELLFLKLLLSHYVAMWSQILFCESVQKEVIHVIQKLRVSKNFYVFFLSMFYVMLTKATYTLQLNLIASSTLVFYPVLFTHRSVIIISNFRKWQLHSTADLTRKF